MTDFERPPKGGGQPRSPKRRHGRGWLLKRSRNGRSWAERKLKSRSYCVTTHKTYSVPR